MFLIKHSLCAASIKLMRPFSLVAARYKSHYDSLGLTPHATQTDIKTAYYKLSMQYHPDKNKGSEEAAQIFRDITAAYEVLGNLKLRKLYDKGILHTAGPQFTQQQDEGMKMADDSKMKFYESRQYRGKAPTPTGRSPIYNFDEWTQAHYGASFARREEAKLRYKMREEKRHSDEQALGFEVVIFVIASLCVLVSYNFIGKVKYDVVEEKVEDKNDEVANSLVEKNVG